MKYKKNILLIILIISSLSLILFPKSVIGSIADIHYSFDKAHPYTNTNLTVNSQNLQHNNIITNTYNATYSFTNDIDGTNPVNWDIAGTGGTAEVISDIGNYDKVLEVYDAGATDPTVEQEYDLPQTYGTVESWMRFTNIGVLQVSYWGIKNGAGRLSQIAIGNNVIQYLDDIGGNWHNTGFGAPNLNTWYHFRIDFETTVGGYMGLAQYEWHLFINGIEFGDYTMFQDEVESDHIQFTFSGNTAKYTYIDAVAYSWDSAYDISDNYRPYIQETSNSLLSNDKYEFEIDSIGNPHNIGGGDPVPYGWLFDEDANNLALINEGGVYGLESGDYVVSLQVKASGGFYNDSLQIEGDNINITWGHVYPSIQTELDTRVYTSIKSLDNTEIVRVNLETINNDVSSLQYWDGGAYQHLEYLYGTTSEQNLYEFNLLLYEYTAYLLFYQNGVFNNSYSFSFIQDKIGINYIGVYAIQDVSGDFWAINTNYLGIYQHNVSLCLEYGYLSYYFGISGFWIFNMYNLFNFNSPDYNRLISGSSPRYIYNLAENYLHWDFANQTDFFSNYYGQTNGNNHNNYLYIMPKNTIELANIEFSIDGVILIHDSNVYFPSFSSDNIDGNESYFYVDDNNKLQFTLIANDTNTEYIQAIFDIPNVVSTDRAISFRGYKTTKAFGYFVIDYLAGITTVDIPIIEKTTRAILPPNKTIDNLIILITDNDQDVILGTTTGYVSQPILLNVLGLGLPIITAGLIEMMIPLLLIIVPTLLISKGFGKQGKKLLIPLFLVFSLIATATFIIPVWIFFIIVFGTSLFLFRNKEIEGEI